VGYAPFRTERVSEVRERVYLEKAGKTT